ncbi:hypothetical protein Kisp01_69600 [Kineosporia sp. NBRC 101677]|uniref:TadE/TadG family type IV pilus assembly protein n=1 Tax=Kineosporia sp. NBRC 101677 TaxID=3032197 RepID=UPI0024A031EB|nr:TadE/TadG family type IV pilus assembly protein [Kineosporia sp. NBRC 101677]GLY19946.1 hypothetical protein Kisp01_69600 [Kineosporia sp. NBRC 101677]
MELLLWFPGLLLIVVMVLQVFSYAWARETAHNAARYGAYHARILGGTNEDGRQEASTYLSEVAGTLVQDPSIVVSRTAGRVDVTITARPRQIPLPGIDLPRFSVHASGPIEQFTAGS